MQKPTLWRRTGRLYRLHRVTKLPGELSSQCRVHLDHQPTTQTQDPYCCARDLSAYWGWVWRLLSDEKKLSLQLCDNLWDLSDLWTSHRFHLPLQETLDTVQVQWGQQWERLPGPICDIWWGLPRIDRRHCQRWKIVCLRESPGNSQGQETHEGVVWCAGSPTELLQLHCARIKRNVPKIFHPLPALKGPEVPPPLRCCYPCSAYLTKSLFRYRPKYSIYPQIPLKMFCSHLFLHAVILEGTKTDTEEKLSKWIWNWSFKRERRLLIKRYRVQTYYRCQTGIWIPSLCFGHWKHETEEL